MSKIGIFGTSGFAREVGDIAIAMDLCPIYIAQSQVEVNDWAFSGDVMLERNVGKYSDMSYVVGVGDNSTRRNIVMRFASDLKFSNLIHPSATFGRGERDVIEMCHGLIVCAGVRFTNNIEVGNFSIFNLNSTIGHDVTVGEFVNLAPGVHVSGNVVIGASCTLGSGAVINQGSNHKKIKIGSGTTIGSGSVVVSDCEANAVYVGVPAKQIK